MDRIKLKKLALKDLRQSNLFDLDCNAHNQRLLLESLQKK